MPRKYTIPVYKAEAADGLADQVRASSSIAYLAKLQDTKLSQEVAQEFFRSVSNAEGDEDQFDLFYLNTILVTTCKNINDDIFDKQETWAARYTPVHKQFNLGHDQSKIIGHMTSSKAVDEKFNIIPDDTPIDNLPAKFHLLTGAVIYRALENDEAQAAIEKIIEEIGEDKWYVSMECLFRNFDYGITYPDGTDRIIARNEDSAWLTKHLKRYGGTGKYNDYSVGRVLRNITFSGKGLVENPANPESIIFNKKCNSFISLGYINSTDVTSANTDLKDTAFVEKSMADTKEKDGEQLLRDQLAEANTLIKELRDEIKNKDMSAVNAKITGLEADITAKGNKINELTSDLNSTKEALANASTKVTEAEAKAKAAEQKATELETALAKRDEEEKSRARVAQLVGKGVDEAKAKQIVKILSDKDDSDFSAMAELFSGVPSTDTSSANVDKSTKGKASKKTVKAEPEDEEEDEEDLDLEVEDDDDDSALAVSSVDSEVDGLRTAMASMFDEMLHGSAVEAN